MLAAGLLACVMLNPTMPDPALNQFPFITRDMLRFGQTAKVELRVDVQADAADTLAISGITREGSFTYKMVTAATSLPTSQTFGLSDIPIMVSVRDSVNSLEQGQCFVTLSLLINGDVVQQLTSGLVYAQKSLSWPQTQQVDLRPGGGRIQRIIPAHPAANVDIQATVPAGEIWKIRDITFLLTTGAAVANRRCSIYVSTPHDATLNMWADTDQTASLTRIYHGGNVGAGNAGANGLDIFIPIPNDFLLFAGDTIGMTCTNRQAADQMTEDEITIEKWFRTT